MSTDPRSATSVKEYFEICKSIPSAIGPHLDTLRHYASRCSTAAEFGVKRGFSSSALLMGASVVHSWDIKETPQALHLKNLTNGRWHYTIGDSIMADVPPVELLFIDSLHTYAQVRDELSVAASRVSHYLLFHDTITFGSVGADGESGRQLWNYSAHAGESVPEPFLGIRPAIDGLMINDPSWSIVEHNTASHGLLVLRRRR